MKYTIFDRYITGFLELTNQYKQPNMVVAEVGVYDGGTTSVIAPIVKQENGKYIAIDWFKGNQTIPPGPPGDSHGYDDDQHDIVLEDFYFNINQSDCKDIIKVIDNLSLEAVNEIEDKSLDICFIDADHRYEAVKADILAYIPKIKDGGILCGHDFDGGEEHFNTFTPEELGQDRARGIHAGVTQAIGEIIGFDKITRYSQSVWAVRINKKRQFENL